MKDRTWIIGNNLKNIRKYHGMTQEDLAQKCCLSISMIKKVEAGKAKLSLDKFLDLLDIFKLSSDALICNDHIYNSTNEIYNTCMQNRNEKEITFALFIVRMVMEGKDKFL